MELNFSAALLTAKDIYAADQNAAKRSIAPFTLMERAGQALTSVLLQRHPKSKVLIICGPGNNGGDGFVVARLLAERGWPVRVATKLGQLPNSSPALEHARLWSDELLPFSALDLQSLQQYDLIIDAGFGVGLSRPLCQAWQRLISLLRECQRPLIAIDLPTGLGDDGSFWVEAPIAAKLTLSLLGKKLAHVLAPGRDYCGEVVICDIGLDAGFLPQAPIFYENSPTLWSDYWWRTRPHAQTHKYHRGHVVVYGGPQFPGAACLAALAAGRSGAGLVTILTEPSSWSVYATQMQAVMIQSLNAEKDMATWATDPRVNAIVLGPGAVSVPALGGYLNDVLEAQKPCVLDAEALTVLAAHWSNFQNKLGSHCVLTPHAGEFARLFPNLAADNGLTRLERVQQAAQQTQATIVLKGAETLIADPKGFVAINIEASPYLATAGSGDVLSGTIAAFLGQQIPAFIAAALAVWLHGRAGKLLGLGLIADDLPLALARAQQDLQTQLSRTI